MLHALERLGVSAQDELSGGCVVGGGGGGDTWGV